MSKKVITLIQTLTLLLLPVLLNGINVSLSVDLTTPLHQEEFVSSSPVIPSQWLETVRKVIKESEKSEIPFEVKTVVIDAGHGGHDPGCSGAHSREKHIALAISKKLAEIMRERFPALQVILTRDKDVFIPLQERAAIANRNEADMFISIHCNYMPGSSATRGTETYVMGLHTADENLEVAKRENAAILHEDNYVENYGGYDPNSPEGHIMLSMFQNAFLEQSISLANKVEERFAESARKSRGVKQAGFLVLRETAMPSILIEAGFLSSRREEGYLKTAEGQLVIANAILEAFAEYKYEVEAVDLTTEPLLAKSVQSRQGLQPMKTANVVTIERKAQPSQSPPTQQQARSVQPQQSQSYAAYKNKDATPVNTKPSSQQRSVTVEPERMIIPQPNQVQRAPNPSPSYRDTPVTANTVRTSAPSRPASTEPVDQPMGMKASPKQQNIRFCVQLAASPKPLVTSTEKWQRISYRIEVIQESRMYKYQARHFLNFQQAFSAKLQVQRQGFKDAFIVAYKNGEKIPLQEAKQELGL